MIESDKDKGSILGAWIPGEVFFNPKLTALDIRAFWMINSLDQEGNCFASNDFIAQLLNCSLSSATNAITKLKKMGYVKQVSFDGKTRVLSIDHGYKERWAKVLPLKTFRGRLLKSSEAESECFKSINKKDYNKESSKEDVTGRPVSSIFVDYSYEAEKLFKFWNSLGAPLRGHQEKKSKTFDVAMDQLDRQLNHRYDEEQIAAAMVLYHQMVSDQIAYVLSPGFPGHLVGLDEFFGFNTFTKSRMIEKNIAFGIHSWFEECVRGTKYINEKYGRYVEDEYPVVTAMFKQLWIEQGFDQFGLLPRDENNFRRASIELMRFVHSMQGKVKFSRLEIIRPALIVKYVFGAIKADLGGREYDVTTGWLCSKNTYERRLPKYLMDNSLLDR
jgi:hypothetical protein